MSHTQGNDRRVNFAEEEPMTLGEKISHRMDQFREMVSSGCCSCANKCPSVAVVLVSALVLLMILAAIPLTLMLTASTSKMSTDGKEFPQFVRNPKFWPKPDAITIDRDDDTFHGISMSSMFPSNVSTCTGFGFACTDAVYSVIPTSKRCDGFYDCGDKSDEQNCKSCQTLFSCPARPITEDKSKNKKHFKPEPTLICLTALQLCDGVEHCLDGSDETVMCKSNCTAEEYRCPGQTLCLPSSAMCDGVADCNDGSDENDCKNCAKGSHKCGRICVKQSEVCDGTAQCEDGSDEKECDCKSCSGSDKALCDDGTCILRSQVCDGKKDCSDGMDEENCPGTCFSKSKPDKRITCSNGRKYTVKEACSGEFDDCSSSCPKCDSKTTFQCPNSNGGARKCIARRMVCDGIPDCADGADEKNCQCDLESGMQFKCDRKCVELSRRCDGVQDCNDMSDEKGCEKCPSDSFKCSKDKTCLPALTRCNGIAECSDGSDEKDCTCDECTGVHSDTYMCDGSKRCLLRKEVCSPYSACPNATHADKAYCASLILQINDQLPW